MPSRMVGRHNPVVNNNISGSAPANHSRIRWHQRQNFGDTQDAQATASSTCSSALSSEEEDEKGEEEHHPQKDEEEEDEDNGEVTLDVLDLCGSQRATSKTHLYPQHHHRPRRKSTANRSRRPECHPQCSLTMAAWCGMFGCACLLLILVPYAFSPDMSGPGGGIIPTDVQPQPTRPYNSSRAQSVVDALCEQWSLGRYAGDLCETLCGDTTRQHSWTLSDYMRGGNKHVLRLHHNGKDMIVKMQHPYPRDYDHQLDIASIDDDTFTDLLLDIVNDHLRLGWPRHYKNHLVRKLWPPHTKQNRSGIELDEAERRSLWALLQQDEFINVAILQMSRVTPKLLGVCGHAYQVEYLIPFRMKTYYLNLKAKILVHLMGTLKLFHEFLNEPFQWCDVKFDNLGLSADYPKRFVVMDSDQLYTESKLDTLLRAQRCSNHSDCGIFDCASRCDLESGFCTGRTNDNIDVICKKLIIGQLFGAFWSKSNRYLAACHAEEPINVTKRINELRLVWAWTLSDV